MRLIDCFSELLGYTVYITGDDPSAAVLSYEDANQRYEDLSARAEVMRSRAGFSDKDWREGLFAVSALIDEMVLCSSWPERGKWQVTQLQHRFFNTTNAGAEFYEHIASLQPGQEHVREVYDWCLAMGFKGTYFRSEDAAHLDEITKMNRSLAKGGIAEEDTLHLFPDAYGAERRDRRKGLSGTIIFTVAIGIIPVIIYIGLFFFYSNVLKGILAGYFQ
ncbi:MAG: DotU family type IV/VI secretion system protein [Syntrophorhabdaceae bacterium]